jgi:hypothetical protein
MRYPTMDEFIRAMSDPVGYVEAHGGIQQFMARQLMPSTAPLPARLTPAPTFTPVPGSLTGVGGAPPAPNTGFGPQPKRSKLGFVIAGILIVAAAAAGVFIVLNGKSKQVAQGSNDQGGTPPIATVTPDAAMAMATIDAQDKTVTPLVDAAPPPPPVSTTAKITLKSMPVGAAIWQDGKDTGKLTPSVIELGKDVHKVQFELRLKGFQVRVLDDMDADAGDQTIALDLKPEEKKKPPVIPHGPHRGSNGSSHNDTGLMKPGED